MANRNEFEQKDRKPAACSVCEAMLLEAVDGALTEDEQRVFDAHIAGCAGCAKELGEAQRGAAWMAMLKGHTPEPSAMLLEKILAQTTGASAVAQAVASPLMTQSAGHERATLSFSATFAAWRQRVTASFALDNISQSFHPRLAMTASMAFVSLALTMNLFGVRLADVAHTLSEPSSIRRSVADAGASARRSFQNLRVVNVVESRVSDLRTNDELGRFTRQNDDEQSEPGSLSPAPSKQDETPKNDDAPKGVEKQKKAPQKSVPQGSSWLLVPASPKQGIQKEVQS